MWGDFSKLGLLRLLGRYASEAGLDATCAVLWWATREAGGAAGDGRHTGYLEAPAFMAADSELLLGLRGVVAQVRAIQTLETAGLLPRARFHGTHLDAREPLTPKQRAANREVWLDEAIGVASDAAFVCVDPDNGLATPRMSPRQRDSKKSVFLDELRQVAQPPQTLVLYHHATRLGSHAQQAERLRAQLAAAFPEHEAPIVLRAPRGSVRFYVVVPTRKHAALLRRVLAELKAGRWDRILQEVV